MAGIAQRAPRLKEGQRGLIIGPRIHTEAGGIRFDRTDIASEDLAFYCLFWDRLVWPIPESFRFERSPDVQFLCGTRDLKCIEIPVIGKGIPADYYEVYARTFKELDQQDQGRWAFGRFEQSGNAISRVSPNDYVLAVKLHHAIPLPAGQLPLGDVLAFRAARVRELHALRASLDTIAERIGSSLATGLAFEREFNRLTAAIDAYVDSCKGCNIPLVKGRLTARVALDKSISYSKALETITAFGVATVSGSSVVGAASLAALSWLQGAVSLQIGPMIGSGSHPFEYVAQLLNEPWIS